MHGHDSVPMSQIDNATNAVGIMPTRLGVVLTAITSTTTDLREVLSRLTDIQNALIGVLPEVAKGPETTSDKPSGLLSQIDNQNEINQELLQSIRNHIAGLETI